MLLIAQILLILALVCFFLATFKIEPARMNFLPLGLLLWAISTAIRK
jgi:hypothetical protein